MLNIGLKLFKQNHLKSKNQVLYYSFKSNGLKEIENLINNFLNVRNSFISESVEKGFIKGRYTIFGKNPDKIWEFNNNNCVLNYENKKKKLKGKPKNNIEKIIELIGGNSLGISNLKSSMIFSILFFGFPFSFFFLFS